MKKLLVALLALPLLANAGDFGKEANKGSVAAKKKALLVTRENPETGEVTVFDGSTLDKKVIAFIKDAKTNQGKLDTPEVREALDKLEKEQRGTVLASRDSKQNEAPTTAWFGYYYGYTGWYSFMYSTVYYVRPVFYTPVYYTTYSYSFWW